MLPNPFGFGVGVAKGEKKVKRFAGSLLVVALAHASALGGTITFTAAQNVFDNTVAADVAALSSIEFVVKIADFDNELGLPGDVGEALDGLDVLVGSTDDLSFVNFVFSDAVFAASLCNLAGLDGNCAQSAGPGDVYPNGDFKFGFTAITGPVLLGAGGFEVGSLFVDASALVSDLGDHSLIVNGDFDGRQSSAALGSPLEALFGGATVTITPEPATMTLLGLASLALIRRRKRA